MSKCHALILFATAAIALAGCSESSSSIAERSLREEGPHQSLSVIADPARGRRWVLGWGAAYAYDTTTGELIRRVPLSGASLSGARESGPPGMVLSRSGAVIVSSNAEPVLWRIDADRLDVQRLDIAVDSDKDKDFGFTDLAWSADEKTLYALSAVAGSQWRIDLDTATASKISTRDERKRHDKYGTASIVPGE
jgi:outer membrane protein assembly factor BamB